MEFEYMAMYAYIQELVLIRGVFGELELSALVCESTPLFVNDESAKARAENPVHHKRSKNIEINGTGILKSVLSADKQLASDHFKRQAETSLGK